LNQGESERFVESERQFEQRLERGDRYRPSQGRRRHWFRGTLYTTWYLLLAAAAVSAVYHLLAT